MLIKFFKLAIVSYLLISSFQPVVASSFIDMIFGISTENSSVTISSGSRLSVLKLLKIKFTQVKL